MCVLVGRLKECVRCVYLLVGRLKECNRYVYWLAS